MSSDEAVAAALDDARRFGFLGPGPVGEQIDHSSAFAVALEQAGVGPAGFLDLGSGGGVPGLVLAARWPGQQGALLDSSARRTAFLRRTVVALGWDSRVTVLEGRAESLARTAGLREAFSLVVARSFASPAVTAEIGGAFVAVGGALVVSEPDSQEPTERWPADRLGELGLSAAEVHRGNGAGIAVIRRIATAADRWPRGVGTPAKRPLW
jgi:16S rRNA (guanine527-N7)-methyltransferase